MQNAIDERNNTKEHFYNDILPNVVNVNIKQLFNLDRDVFIYTTITGIDSEVKVYDDKTKRIYSSLERYFNNNSFTVEYNAFDVYVPRLYRSEPSIHLVDYVNDEDVYVYLDNGNLAIDLLTKLSELASMEKTIEKELEKLH